MSSPPAERPLGAAISKRAQLAVAGQADKGTPTREEPALDRTLIESLRHHLLAGETHYPERPGMPALRERIGARLPVIGYAPRATDEVLVTTSEGESLLVTLLGLKMVPGGFLKAQRGGRHQLLLDWLGVHSGPDVRKDTSTSFARYQEAASLLRPDSISPEAESTPMIDAIGDLLFSKQSSGNLPPEAPNEHPNTIVIGNLAGLPGLDRFSLGFVTADREILQEITKWKQASSICSPAPSQRAALWALGVRP